MKKPLSEYLELIRKTVDPNAFEFGDVVVFIEDGEFVHVTPEQAQKELNAICGGIDE